MQIREAMPTDAEQIIAHVLRLTVEPSKMVAVGSGEFTVTVEQERKLLTGYAMTPNSISLVAEIEGKIAGILNCTGGKRSSNRHCGIIGMSVGQPWRGQGVGTALMSHVVEWARQNEILTRLELDVYAHNAAALALYRKFGFLEEGVKKRAYFQEGAYIDAIAMALLC